MAWKKLRWVRPRKSGDVVVWVNVTKLDASWSKDVSFYVGPGVSGPGNGKLQKYQKFGEWIERHRQVHMPHVCLEPEGHASFTDGRHRFAWLRDHGLKAIQITTNPQQGAIMKQRFGTRSRKSQLRTNFAQL